MNRVIVTTAVKLSTTLKKEVETTVRTKLGQTPYRLEEVVDPNVIGGVCLQFNAKIYDATLKAKLSALQAER